MVTVVVGTKLVWLNLAEWQSYAKAAVASSMRRLTYFRMDYGKLIEIVGMSLSL